MENVFRSHEISSISNLLENFRCHDILSPINIRRSYNRRNMACKFLPARRKRADYERQRKTGMGACPRLVSFSTGVRSAGGCAPQEGGGRRFFCSMPD